MQEFITQTDFSYDELAYPGQIIPHTNPDRLGAIGKLHGMNPAPAEKCRVLELGCGTGTNLNWLACNLPESEFVGVDLGQNHITEAKKHVTELELKNISFFQANILEITENTFGKFDYIMAHGLFSWVPPIVRQKILILYNEMLNPNGVGYISYNVYPGCYQRQIVGDIMRFYSQKFEKPIEKVQKSIEFIELLFHETNDSSLFHQILKDELESFAKRPLGNIYHDDFSEINQPFYFSDFIAEADRHGLKFLSESNYLAVRKDNFISQAPQFFENISQNIIEFEQYMDFWEYRKFRQTLLCKKDVNPETEINPAKIKELYISSFLRPVSPELDLDPQSLTEFTNKNGKKIEIGHTLTKVVLSYLVNLGAHPIRFDDLIKKADTILQSQGIIYENLEKEAEITALILLRLYSPNSVGLHTVKSNCLNYVSEKPKISKFPLWQSIFTFNFHGFALNADDEITHSFLNLLDGTRRYEDLLAELTELISSNQQIKDKDKLLSVLPEKLSYDLSNLAKMGFLVG